MAVCKTLIDPYYRINQRHFQSILLYLIRKSKFLWIFVDDCLFIIAKYYYNFQLFTQKSIHLFMSLPYDTWISWDTNKLGEWMTLNFRIDQTSLKLQVLYWCCGYRQNNDDQYMLGFVIKKPMIYTQISTSNWSWKPYDFKKGNFLRFTYQLRIIYAERHANIDATNILFRGCADLDGQTPHIHFKAITKSVSIDGEFNVSLNSGIAELHYKYFKPRETNNTLHFI